jgi:hypothetical protein
MNRIREEEREDMEKRRKCLKIKENRYRNRRIIGTLQGSRLK